MQFVGVNVVDVHPVQIVGLAVCDAGVGVAVTVGDDRVVTPRPVVVGENVDDAEMVFLDSDFFPCFAFRSGDGIFVGVERTTG